MSHTQNTPKQIPNLNMTNFIYDDQKGNLCTGHAVREIGKIKKKKSKRRARFFIEQKIVIKKGEIVVL